MSPRSDDDPSRQPPHHKSPGFFALIALIVAVPAIGMVSCMGGDTKNSAATKTCGDADMAMIMSEKFVKRELRSPSTADFPAGQWKEDVRVGRLGECRWLVKSWVDSQNAFGATIRTHYVIEMEYLPASRHWRGRNLEFARN